MPSYAPMSTKGVALEEVTLALIAKGAVELAPLPSPGFYSRLFVVWKTLGSWRPVIDPSHLNRFLASSHFKMETIQSVLLSLCPGDWMVSVDLKKAYLQVSTVCGFWPSISIPSSLFRSRLGPSGIHQFRRSCTPWISVYVAISTTGLVQSPSRDAVLRDLRVVLNLCRELGIVVNPEKSNFIPLQRVLYLGTILDSRSFVASPSPDRIARLLSLGDEFLSSVRQPASCWQSLSQYPVLSVPSCSGGQASHAVPPVSAAPVLGSPRRLGSHCLDSPLSSRPPLVVIRVSSVSGGLSCPALPGPRLLVRRLGRGLGCSPVSRRGFRPLVSRRGVCFHQRAGASGNGEGSPPLPVFSGGVHCDRLCGQLNSSGLFSSAR